MSSPGWANGPVRAPPLRYIGVFFGVLMTIWIGLGVSSHPYGAPLPSVKSLLGGGSDARPPAWLGGKIHKNPFTGKEEVKKEKVLATYGTRKANAAFVVLVRNVDLWSVIGSIRSMEDRFNGKGYHYPYVFLNNEPFTDEFKRHTSRIASGLCTYGFIPSEEWGDIPPWIDQEAAAKARQEMVQKKVIYGGSLNYRQMCRYQSGFFWRHPLLDDYEYYWRIEPNVKYFCDLDYDPLLFMQDNKKMYGWTVSIFEYAETIPTLWNATKEYINANPESLAKPNLMNWISDDGGYSYNRCHFWSNFEIGSLAFWRSEAYRKYFDHLDKAGGFFMERWGDAPVHSIAAALFLKPEEVHFFQDIGYRHEPFQHCPQESVAQCGCNPNDSFENHWYSCTAKYKGITNYKWVPPPPPSSAVAEPTATISSNYSDSR